MSNQRPELARPALSALIAAFMAAKEAEAGVRTRRIYARDLTALDACFQGALADELDAAALGEFLDGLARQDGEAYGPGSLGRIRASLAVFFKWASDQRLLAHNPMAGVTPLRRPIRLHGAVSPETANTLLARATEPRERALVALALACRLRIGQVLGLDAADLLLDGRVLRVPGAPTRLIYVPPFAREALRAYLADRPQGLVPLFHSTRGRLSYPHAVVLLHQLTDGLMAEDGAPVAFLHLRQLALARADALPELPACEDGSHLRADVLEAFLLRTLGAERAWDDLTARCP